MANPQFEKGYVKIANELYEAVAKWHLSSYEYRVFIFIIRKTYGWNKKSDWISLSQFVEGTCIKESHICRAINLLIKQNLITKGGNRDNPEYSIQKDYDKWIKLPKGVRSHHPLITKGGNSELPKGVIEITKGGNSEGKKGGDTKDTIFTKDTTTKDSVAEAPTPKENAEKFFNGVLALVRGEDVAWLKELLSAMAEKNTQVSKAALWNEIKRFCGYWTEKNPTGKKEKWQMQKTFEVDRRLATWFSRAGFSEFSASGFNKKPKGKEIIGL